MNSYLSISFYPSIHPSPNVIYNHSTCILQYSMSFKKFFIQNTGKKFCAVFGDRNELTEFQYISMEILIWNLNRVTSLVTEPMTVNALAKTVSLVFVAMTTGVIGSCYKVSGCCQGRLSAYTSERQSVEKHKQVPRKDVKSIFACRGRTSLLHITTSRCVN